MDKNLASYLFEKETLYVNPVKESDLPVKVETSEAPAAVEKEVVANTAPLVESDEIPVASSPEPKVNVAPPFKEVVITPPEVVVETLKVFNMETLHLVVVNTLAAEEREFLVKVLMALNMSLAKVDLLDISITPNQKFKEIIYSNSVQSILFFGDAGGAFAPKLGLTDYHVKELKNIRFLTSASLTEVSLNLNNEKRQLWGALKALYTP